MKLPAQEPTGGLMDPYIAIEHALPQRAHDRIMKNAVEANPQLEGAKLADILDTYDNHDGCLWFTEPLFEEFGTGWLSETRPIEFYRVAAIAVALMEWPRPHLPSNLMQQGLDIATNPVHVLAVELLAWEATQRAAISGGIEGVVRDG